MTFHYIPYHYVGVSHCLTIFYFLFLFICLSLLLYCSVMWAERTEWGSMCDQRQLVVSRDDNILQSNTQCVYSIIHLSTQCVYFILCVNHQLLLPSGRLPPPLIESNQINHKNKWYSHLVIPKCVVIWLLDTHKPWLFQYEYEWVRILLVLITNNFWL